MMLTDPVYRSRMADTPLRERVVVGVAVGQNGLLSVACQDGTVFRQVGRGDWYESAPIPGTPRWYQVTGESMEAADAASTGDAGDAAG